MSKLRHRWTRHGTARRKQTINRLGALVVEAVVQWWSTKASLSSVPSAAKAVAPIVLGVGRGFVVWAPVKRREYADAVGRVIQGRPPYGEAERSDATHQQTQ